MLMVGDASWTVYGLLRGDPIGPGPEGARTAAAAPYEMTFGPTWDPSGEVQFRRAVSWPYRGDGSPIPLDRPTGSRGRATIVGHVAQVYSEDRTIVVGVDGSDRSQLALKWAADEARLREALLRIVHAGDDPPRERPRRYPMDGFDLSAAAAVVDDAVGLVATRHPTVMTRGEVLSRSGASALVEASELADLLVVGARGRGLTGLPLGSVSRYCIRHAPCPVVIVRSRSVDPSADGGSGRIVVGVDGSAGSSRALRWALDEADRRSGSLDAVFAWQYPPIGGMIVGPRRGYENRAREIVERVRSYVKQRTTAVHVNVRDCVGDSISVLLAASEDADLLVVGWEHHERLAEALVGTVANQCADQADCPVVVVRPSVSEPVPVGAS